jgi:hypothetical protein
MYNDTGSPTLIDCVFIENRTSGNDDDGAGMYNGTGNPTLTDCAFIDNLADGQDSDAGGMYNVAGDPTLTRCVFERNIADERGGGMRNGGNPTLIKCSFIENESNLWGGGLYTSGSPTLIDCVFRDNFAFGFGGGIYHSGGGLTLVHGVFTGNHADEGGGLFTDGASLANCVFRDNTAYSGGGMTNTSGDTAVVNGTFSGNSAVQGGGVVNTGQSPRYVNCTFRGNIATEIGGALHQTAQCSPTLTNCVIWDNMAPSGGQVSDAGWGATIATYSCVQGGWVGEGNIDVDPLFVDADGPDDVVGTSDDDLRPQSGSPCVNAGTNDVPELPEIDLDGHARVLCGIVDMGAYEYGIGDHQCDGVVDLGDFAAWGDCMTGPDAGPYADNCEAFDYEFDGDVDLLDFARFQGGIHELGVE